MRKTPQPKMLPLKLHLQTKATQLLSPVSALRWKLR